MANTELLQRIVNAAFGKKEDIGRALMIDLFCLTAQQREMLMLSLHRSHGVAQIWVHSHFLEQDTYREEEKVLMPYKNKRASLIRNSLKSPVPVIALIELGHQREPQEKQIQRYSKYYSEYTGRPIYYVNTFPFDPVPHLPTDKRDKTPEVITKNWDSLIKLFEELGINTVIVSGRDFSRTIKNIDKLTVEEHEYINANPSAFYKDGKFCSPNLCVGFTLKHLSQRGIRTFLSNVTHTETKQDPLFF